MAVNDIKSAKYEEFFLEHRIEENKSGDATNKVKNNEDRIEKEFLWYGKRFGENRVVQLSSQADYIRTVQRREDEIIRKFDEVVQ